MISQGDRRLASGCVQEQVSPVTLSRGGLCDNAGRMSYGKPFEPAVGRGGCMYFSNQSATS